MPKQNQNHLTKNTIFIHVIKKFIKEDFILDYNNINWVEVVDINRNDVNFSMENFLSKFNELLDTHMPLRKLTQKEFKQRYKPWISKNILTKITEKNKIFRKYLKSTNEVRKTELFDKFKILKKEITHLTRSGKKPTTKNILLKIRVIFKRLGKV